MLADFAQIKYQLPRSRAFFLGHRRRRGLPRMPDRTAYRTLVGRASRYRQEVGMENTHAIAGLFVVAIDLEYTAQSG